MYHEECVKICTKISEVILGMSWKRRSNETYFENVALDITLPFSHTEIIFATSVTFSQIESGRRVA